jgi:hypothetical protein
MDSGLSEEDMIAMAIQESEESYKRENQNKIIADRAIIEEQKKAYEASLAADREKEKVEPPKNPKSLEELRQARLKAFAK